MWMRIGPPGTKSLGSPRGQERDITVQMPHGAHVSTPAALFVLLAASTRAGLVSRIWPWQGPRGARHWKLRYPVFRPRRIDHNLTLALQLFGTRVHLLC